MLASSSITSRKDFGFYPFMIFPQKMTSSVCDRKYSTRRLAEARPCIRSDPRPG